MKSRHFARLLALLSLTALGHAQDVSTAPEAATGYAAKPLSTAREHMIVAANPLAASAGLEMLRAGGSAIDAIIAAQMVLGLVEPQSSGLGGGAFVVHFDAARGETMTFDGRETAPAAAAAGRFLRDGEPIPFNEAQLSGASVGVPGVLRALELAHKKYGKLSWARLFEPAIVLAQNGFAMPSRLSKLLEGERVENFSPATRDYFFDANGKPRAEGAILKNPDYAEVLHAIAAGGVAAFYEGALGAEIARAVADASGLKGDITIADLASYRAIERPAVCFGYLGNRICGMGPPSSGAVAVGETLKLIEPFEAVQGPAAAMTPAALHLIGEAEKLSYADRGRYIADPGFIDIPSGLLDDVYINERRALIDPARVMEKPAPGMPPPFKKRAQVQDATVESSGTSHISVVDKWGNAAGMTTSIEAAFGSHILVKGFLLNNTMTDFSFRAADKDRNAIGNAIAPGKRPRSTMSPILVFDSNGRLKAVTGTPGGPKIIMILVKTLVAILNWGMNAEVAAALPNFGSEGGPFQLEDGQGSSAASAGLKSLGHTIVRDAFASGVHTILVRGDYLEGGADPRRDGIAIGD